MFVDFDIDENNVENKLLVCSNNGNEIESKWQESI